MQFRNFPPQQIGFPVRADWARKVIDAIEESRPRPRPGQTMNRNSYGVMLGEEPGAAKEVELSESFPFKVRWMITNRESRSGEWQIYLPRGCATLLDGRNVKAYVPVNDSGKGEDGEELFRWYRIGNPKDEDATIGTSRGYAAKQWTVYVLMQPWPRMKATTSEKDTDFKTHMFSQAVATICEIERDDRTFHSVTQLYTGGQILNEYSDGGAFGIRYEMESDAPGSKVRAYVVNQSKIFGRLYRENIEKKDVTGAKSVWLKIRHADTNISFTIEKDLSGSGAQSDDNQTFVKIYDMEDDVVTYDNRSAITGIGSNFYTS